MHDSSPWRPAAGPLARVGIPSIALLLALATPARADTADDAVREALAKQEGDVDSSEVLRQSLTATDKKYSMLPAGRFAATYDFSYSYIGEQLIEADFEESDLTFFRIENTQGHTINNVVSVDYGVLNNLTANVAIPLVSKYSDQDDIDGNANAFGDVSMGLRYQPFSLGSKFSNVTLSATAVLPTGRSPFESVPREVATGSGHASFIVGLNTSKVIDPVAIFGSVNLSHSLPEEDISLIQADGSELDEVAAGRGISWGAGFAYALSYDITTTLSFQQSFQDQTELTFYNAAGEKDVRKTSKQTSATLNTGLGVRVSPLTTLNFSVGIGLTPDSPDFSLGVNVPINF